MHLAKSYLFILLALLIPTTLCLAQTVGTTFTVGNISYQITNKDLNTPANNTVGVYQIGGSGSVSVPSSVKNSQDQETYQVTSVIPYISNQVQSGVTAIVLPEGLLSLPDGAFFQSDNFKSITIPSTCTAIGDRSFQQCYTLETFNVSSGNQNYQSINGVLFNKSGDVLVHFPCAKGGDYAVPSGVTTIASNAFGQCTGIGTLTIPASVVNMTFDGSAIASIATTAENIKVDASNPKFSDINGVLCSKDQTVLYSYPARRNTGSAAAYTVPQTITTIAPQAFYVSNIGSINLNNVVKIGASAFQFSSSLQTVNIGAKVSSIGDGAFTGCSKLTTITVDTNNTYFKAQDNVLFTKDGTHLMICPATKTGSYTVPSSVTAIDARAFAQTNVSSVTISKNVKTIGTGAFSYCNATSITFEDGSVLESIGDQAFYKANKLQTISLPSTVKSMGELALSSIPTLTSIKIDSPSQLNTLGRSVFSSNPNLSTLDLGGTTSLATIPANMVSGDSGLKSFVVPASVTSIAENAFQNSI